jgi:uncharacterized protein YqgC (DUF456 family)
MALLIAVVLVFVGLVGIIAPGVPGPMLIFAGLLLAAWSDGFAHVGVTTLVVIGILTAATYVIDILVMALGMKHLGATRRAMIGAALGTLAGLFFGLPGVIIGPFAGAVIGEFTAYRDVRAAGRAGTAAWFGFLVGMAAKVGLAFVMVGIFLAAWFVV